MFYSSDCPDEQRLAEYADRQLIGDERHAVERHLATCDTCAEQVAFLVSVPAQNEPVPYELLRKALALGKAQGKGAFATWKPVAVGAFALLLLVAVLSWRIIEPQAVRKGASSETTILKQSPFVAQNQVSSPTPLPDHDAVRGSSSADARFLFPLPGSVVDPATLVFRWKPVTDAQFYEVELVSDDGSVIWQQRVQSASTPLPTSVHLIKGKTYFVRLRVHSVRGSVEQTKAVGFIIE
jgi:anti-sigma factor RsiW